MSKRLHNVIFVLGGPGSGKGTQSELLCAQRNLKHLSIGDILRAEQGKPGSAWASIIELNIRSGRIGAKEMTVSLLRDAMLHHNETSQPTQGFVIDGFPQTLDRAQYSEDTIEQPLAVILLDCPQEVMKERLKQRAALIARADDNDTTIKNRLDTFTKETRDVIDHYDHRRLLIWVNGMGPKDEVQCRVLEAVDEVLARQRQP